MRFNFIADQFLNSFIGGAELSIQSHIDTAPDCLSKKIRLIKSKDFNPRKFNPKKDFLIFGNFYDVKPEYLPIVTAKFKYVVEECDYKYCVWRSSHKHKAMELRACNCHETEYGQNVAKFLSNALWVFWKSIRQREEYFRLFPKIDWANGTIIGGVFSDADIDYILSLRDTPKDEKYFVLYSNSWIKGHRESMDYCRAHKLPIRPVGGVSHKEALKSMAASKGIVYMPRGFDVSCRMITEAKLLHLDIRTNDLVQHVTEKWFNGTDEEMIAFLRSRNPEFWRITTELSK